MPAAMMLRACFVIGSAMGLLGCGGGGGGKAASPTEPEVAAPDPETQYKACGIYTTRDAELEFGSKSQDELTDADYAKMDNDPSMQHPQDVEACMGFLRFVVGDMTDSMQIVAAMDISYGLCEGEAAVGEACYFGAWFAQLPFWGDTPEDGNATKSRALLEEACERGYPEACPIVETGRDAQGNTWTLVDPEEAAYED